MVKVILPIQDGDYTDGEIQRAFWLTGLRAQIAAWEEMQSMFNGPSLQIVFREKIAALKKELSE